MTWGGPNRSPHSFHNRIVIAKHSVRVTSRFTRCANLNVGHVFNVTVTLQA